MKPQRDEKTIFVIRAASMPGGRGGITEAREKWSQRRGVASEVLLQIITEWKSEVKEGERDLRVQLKEKFELLINNPRTPLVQNRVGH